MKMGYTKYGAFCEVFGKTLRNRMLEFILCMEYSDFAVGDAAEMIEISKPKMYEMIRQAEKEGIVKKSRIVSGTQLYKLNKEDPKVKILLNSLMDCIRMVVEETKSASVKSKFTKKMRLIEGSLPESMSMNS